MKESAASGFDYVIVGGGSAGCVLANRLSARPDVKVLLLEAGPSDRNPWIHVPGGIFKLINNPAVDWCFRTEPEPGLGGRSMIVPAGRVLGGSSSMNGMIYIRGQREDFDSWAAQGNAGWSYSDVLPLFRRSEDQARGANEFHGAGGGLCVSDPRAKFHIVDAFIQAGQEAGLPFNPDFNGAAQEGVGPFQITVRAGRRCSAARAFLEPARPRPNLTIVTGALAHSLVMEGTRVVGVQYETKGVTQVARAGREVILSAGAVGSAKLLQLSGIGDPAALEPLGIRTRHALRGVGRNFQDHFQARLVFRTHRPVTLNDSTRTSLHKMFVGMDYVFRRRGALSFGASLAGAFARTDESLERPDVQLHFQPLSLDSYDTGLHTFSAFTISVCKLRPASRGTVMIRSANPRDEARIHGNYLVEKEDCDTMLRGVRLVQRIAGSPALAREVSGRFRPDAGIESDADVLGYVRQTGMTIFHPTGTCRMGHDEDSVVDHRLRVRGLEGLRVADGSIMPTIVSGNTNAAAIMIGEKAADLVLSS